MSLRLAMLRDTVAATSIRLSRGSAGFTLIELLVVMAIIGILSAIIAPAVMSSMAKAYEVNCRNNQRQIATALIIRADDANGYFPSVTSLGESYYGSQPLLLNALEQVVGRDPKSWFCAHSVKMERINAEEEMSANRIGYFYWAWTVYDGAPAPIRAEAPENIWVIQGWNNSLNQLVLLTDHFRDRAYWPIDEDWQYHGGRSPEVPLSQAGTLAVMADGSVQKIAPRL